MTMMLNMCIYWEEGEREGQTAHLSPSCRHKLLLSSIS